MMNLLIALLVTSGQEAAPAPSAPQVKVEQAAAPEKICKQKRRATGEGGARALVRYKVCKTKEEWDSLKSPASS